jgi:hypothetical protein
MLTQLEKAVLDMLLDKPGETFTTLRRQLTCSTVSKREFTGVGFFTEFDLPLNAQVKRDVPDMTISDVGAEFSDLEHGVGFVLFIRGGVVTMLEGYTYDEEWPKSTEAFKIFKINSL